MKELAVKVAEVGKRYGRHKVLDGISLDVKKGEVFGVAGPNGAGKSTLLSILSTVIPPSCGDAFINGYSVSSDKKKVRPLIGYVPQEISLYPRLSGLDNLKFWAEIYNLHGRTRELRISEAIETARLKKRINDRVYTYSGGMKRRLNIVVSLLHRPEVLIMDEPTAGVDIISRKYIMDMMKSVTGEGRTVIFSSHYMEDMEDVCERMAVLCEGRLYSAGNVKELKKKFGNSSIAEIMMALE